MDAVLVDALPRLLDAGDGDGLPRRVGYQPSLDAPSDDPHPSFVERKQVDWSRVRKLLALSEKANHWTNFGPVTAALERFLGRLLGLPEERCVVMCSSATTALHAVIGLHELKLGRKLRVVGCAYGFFSSNIGPLADIVLVDSDTEGMLSLEALAALDPDSYDAVLVTNLFGLRADLSDYRAFCRARGKTLIVDGATAIAGVDRSAPDGDDEVISFHHTKPWGVGEGGCAIIAREDADIVRGFLNFGVNLPRSAARCATNGKISDYASALIIDRLERMPVWSFYYRAQQHRLSRLGASRGLALLSGNNPDAIVAHVALLAPAPVAAEPLLEQPVVLRKYYRPLGDGDCPVAQRLYAHIVNVPAHSGMQVLSDEAALALIDAACAG